MAGRKGQYRRLHLRSAGKDLNNDWPETGLAQGTVPETVREHYASLEHKAGECMQCGSCEKRCPFEVEAMRNMEHAARVFGA